MAARVTEATVTLNIMEIGRLIKLAAERCIAIETVPNMEKEHDALASAMMKMAKAYAEAYGAAQST